MTEVPLIIHGDEDQIWASQALEKDGRFWFYATVEHDGTHPGKAIAVAVSEKPTGPFVDAKGAALITNEMTPKGTHSWEDIDPTVFTDDDGTTWVAWGIASATSPGSSPT